MSARRFALFAAFALLVGFISLNVMSGSLFKSWRLDLTENGLYTLSQGTQRTLNDLSEPVELRLYYSRAAATAAPQLQTYAARVREMMQSFQARSRGRLRFVEIDVEAYSEEEDAAVEEGVEPVRLYQGADPIYFGLVGANAIDDKRIIPFLEPQREPFLEYEITRLVYELENPARTRVALISSLPIGAPEGFGAAAQSMFSTELNRLMEVTRLPPDFTAIPDVDVLAIIHPGALSAAQLYAIDQFILRNGRAFIVLDPAALASQQTAGFDPFNPVEPIPASSTLGPLMERWGVSLAPTVVLDLDHALEVNAQTPDGQTIRAPQPLFFAVPAEKLDREDLMTAWLSRGVNFGLAGGLSVTPRDGIEVQPLARTSGNTMRMPATQALAQPSPQDVMQMWLGSGGRVETIALRLSGNLETAFPGGAPATDAVPSETDPLQTPTTPSSQPVAPVTRSATPAQIVIVADADFLDDNFYVDPSAGPVADNAAFALNAIDVLGGSDALVTLRSRAPSARRMELLEDMERDADRRIQQRQEDLQRELRETEGRLAELQAGGRGSGFFAGDANAEMTPDERLEIERFRRQVVQVRSELRRSERELRRDIDRLQTLIIFLNMWLGPLLVATAGLVLFWRRQARGKAAK